MNISIGYFYKPLQYIIELKLIKLISQLHFFHRKVQAQQTTSLSQSLTSCSIGIPTVPTKSQSTTSNKRHEPKTTFSQFIQELIYSHENGKGRTIHLDKLCKMTTIEKRRLSDLFSSLCALDVCSKICSQCFRWNSMSNIDTTILKISRNLEERALIKKCEFAELFDANQSPSIGELSIKLIEVFLYFGEKELSLSSISKLLSPNPEKTKQVLRRIYLAAYFLEQFNILSHGSKRSVYIFVKDLNRIATHTFTEMSHEIDLKLIHHFRNSSATGFTSSNSQYSSAHTSTPTTPPNELARADAAPPQQDSFSLVISPAMTLLPLMNHIDIAYLNAVRLQRKTFMKCYLQKFNCLELNCSESFDPKYETQD